MSGQITSVLMNKIPILMNERRDTIYPTICDSSGLVTSVLMNKRQEMTPMADPYNDMKHPLTRLLSLQKSINVRNENAKI